MCALVQSNGISPRLDLTTQAILILTQARSSGWSGLPLLYCGQAGLCGSFGLGSEPLPYEKGEARMMKMICVGMLLGGATAQFGEWRGRGTACGRACPPLLAS